MSAPLSITALLRYRRRSLVFGAALIASCYAIDLVQPGLALVAPLRAAWIALVLGCAALQRPERPRLATAAALAASIATGVAVVAIVAADGGTGSIYEGMLIATPYAVLVVMVELPWAAALTGAVCVVGGAIIRVAEGQRFVDVLSWLLLSTVMSALATWGTVAARNAWRLEVDAERARALAVERLAEAERRHAEVARLAEVGVVAARVAHDVNNPLAAVKANVRWLKEQLPPDGAAGEQREVIEDTLASVERIADAIAEMRKRGRS